MASARIVLFLLVLLATTAVVHGQSTEETLTGPNAHELPPEDRGHLFGDWNGNRSRLLDEGVNIDVQYVGDTLRNVSGVQPHRWSNWSRIRGTIDIDLGCLLGWSGLYFHATGLTQGGNNIGQRLDLVANPSGIASQYTSRLDSWWVEKRMFAERLVIRVGQFAGQDFYGTQQYAISYIFEPMGYAFSNLFNTHEVFDPPSTSAAEVRVIPREHLYAKSMVLDGDPNPFAHNPTGFVPQFRSAAVTVAEIGWTPGQEATASRAFENVAKRKLFSGLYKIGGAFNPSHFPESTPTTQRAGNFLLYGMANQALWRSPMATRGIDATVGYDWSPANANAQNRQLTAGVRLNQPLPIEQRHTLAVGYVQSFFSQAFVSAPRHSEHGAEFNALVMVTRSIALQPVVQYFINGGGGPHNLVVLGFRTRIDL